MINIAMFTDSNNLWGTAVTGRSLLEETDSSCQIYLVCFGLTALQKQDIRASWSLENLHKLNFIDFNAGRLKKFRSTRNLKSKVAYGRFFIGECLPCESKCLYLDTDLIICTDLQELYETQLNGATAACVPDLPVRVGNQNRLTYIQETLALKDPARYFNSGVMLIDLKLWNGRGIGNKAVQLAIDMSDIIRFHDQDILNMILEDDWLAVEPRWNTTQYEADSNFGNGILHLTGSRKPWHLDYSLSFKSKFFEILDRTAYAGQRPQNFLGLNLYLEKMSRTLPNLDIIMSKVGEVLGR